MYNIHYKTFFKTLADVESGGNDRAVGKKGEVSAFQILPSMWKEHSEYHCSPYHFFNRTKANQVARKINSYNLGIYKKDTGNLPQVYDMYVMWNYGVVKYKKAKYNRSSLPEQVKERAERFINLYTIYERTN